MISIFLIIYTNCHFRSYYKVNVPPGYYINVNDEGCGTMACGVYDNTHALGFDKPGLNIKSYPEFLKFMVTYEIPQH